MQRQQFIQEFVAHTNRNIFLTGKAGTGKTTLLHHIRTSTYKNCVVAAPTGIAALNAGGVTLHSLLQLPIGAYVPDSSLQLSTSQSQLFVTPKDFRRHIRLQERKIRLLRAIELLVIDEVSMLRADTLDLVDMLLRSVRRNPLPFGGVQVLFIGDLLQLPPVVKPQEWAVLSQYYASPFFFHAHVLRDHPPLYIELTHVYRQEDSDFLGLLNNLRYNRVTPADRAWLESRIDPHFDPIHNDGYVTLTTHNQRADEINQRALDALPGAPQNYHARISGDFPEHLYPIEPMLTLKVGARVMMIKNDQQTPRRFYNGMLGTVEAMEEKKLFVRLEDSELLDVPLYSWENARYTLNADTGETEPDIQGIFRHFPLRLAWAITIHKSQGLTFDRAAIDLEATFASGQAYVALSRLRRPEGLVLLSALGGNSLSIPQTLMDYEQTRANDADLEHILSAEKLAYWQEQTLNAFSWSGAADLWRHHAYSYRMESERSKKSAFGDWAAEAAAEVDELRVVAEKFILQLRSLWGQGEVALPCITDRIQSATQYFLPRWEQILVGLMDVQVKVRGMKKVKEYIDELDALQAISISSVRLLLRIQASMQALSQGQYPDREGLQLEERLEQWIKQVKAQVKTPYIVPTPEEPKAKKKEKAPKEAKISTQEQTLQLLKAGKTITEIAAERGLKPSTITGHVAMLMEQRKVTEQEAGIDEGTMQMLSPLFATMDVEAGLRGVMDATEGVYSYDLLRLYLTAYRQRHSLQDRAQETLL